MPQAQGSSDSADMPPAKVEVAEVRAGALHIERRLLGEVRAQAQAALAAGEAGEVMQVRVREGDRVERGELLVVIDPSRAQAQLKAALAQQKRIGEQLEQAAREGKRLRESGARLVAEIDIERATSREQELSAQRAELAATVAEARAVLNRLRVRAPFAGQVSGRSVDPGDYVQGGDPVLELVGSGSVEIQVEATQDVIAQVREGDVADVEHDGHRAEGTVVGVVRALDRQTRTSTVRLSAGDEDWLMPGATADVNFHLSRRDPDGCLLSRDALVPGAVGMRVIKVVDEKAQPVDVKVVAASGDQALVVGEQLAPGDQVVIRGNERLAPGQPVQVL